MLSTGLKAMRPIRLLIYGRHRPYAARRCADEGGIALHVEFEASFGGLGMSRTVFGRPRTHAASFRRGLRLFFDNRSRKNLSHLAMAARFSGI